MGRAEMLSSIPDRENFACLLRIHGIYLPIGKINRLPAVKLPLDPERENESVDMTKVTSTAEIGRLVRERRRQAGLTLKDAAGMAGVGVRFLSELERGKPTLQIGLAIEVLHLFGLDLYVQPRGERV